MASGKLAALIEHVPAMLRRKTVTVANVAFERKFCQCRGAEKPMTSKRQPNRRNLSGAKLDEMIEEATVDAYGDAEQTGGFFTLLEDRLKLPFKTEVMGMEVAVEQLDMTDDERIVAVCSRGKSQQTFSILDLTLPDPPPEGWEWIEAFRRWARGR
jgi:hypothetical protein